MGIQSESFVYSIPENCYCIICKSVLEDPVEIISCGHHFCCKCFENWKERQAQTRVNNNSGINSKSNDVLYSEVECPYCGIITEEELVRKDKLVWSLIQNMNIFCQNKNNGCTEIFKLGFQELHRCNFTKKSEKPYLKCVTCNISTEDLTQHDCLSELSKLYKQCSVQLTNLEHENDRLTGKLVDREKHRMENYSLLETQFYEEALKYNKEIRELRTRLATLQGEFGRKKGQNYKTSSGIFVSRIVEGGAADQPNKLQLHDRILEVDGINLKEATHDLAVQAFRNSGDPVKMVIQRQIHKNKMCDASTQTFGVMFAVTCGDTRKDANSCYQYDYKSDYKTKKSKWLNPQELIDSINSNQVQDDVVDEVGKRTQIKDENKSDLYDSAYDTLLTQKSSRSSRSPSSVNEISDTESNTTNQHATSPDETERPQVVLRQKKSEVDNSEKRSSTFYIIPGDEEEEANGIGSIGQSWEDSHSQIENDRDYEEYEYEEVTLSKEGDEKFGLFLCYGGNENDVAVYVGDLEENSVADLSGKIMVGDQIVRINNQHVHNVEDAYKMLQHRQVTLIVARAVYEPQSEFYDEAEETDLDLLENILEDDESNFSPTNSISPKNRLSPTEDCSHAFSNGYSSSVSSKSSDKFTGETNESRTASSNESTCISMQRMKSPVSSPTENDASVKRRPGAMIDSQLTPPRSESPSNLSKSPNNDKTKESKKHSFKNFVKQRLGSSSSDKKDKRPNSLSDDTCDLNKLPRCDSHSSNGSGSGRSLTDANSKTKQEKTEHNDVSKAKLKEQRQLSRMKAYLDSPSLIRHRINNNMIVPQTIQNGGVYYQPNGMHNYTGQYTNTNNVLIGNQVVMSKPQINFNPHLQDLPNSSRPNYQQQPPRSPRHPLHNNMTESVTSLRSAMKNPLKNTNKSAKHVHIDPHQGWNDTERRVWEEFKIIQSMEAKETNKENTNNNVEAEWRVRRSKDGKHIYIKKSNSSRNKILREREEQIREERCGITTDDDAFTIYQGQYWNRDQRKRQLNRHNDRRKRLLQKAIAKQSYENKTEKALNEMAQRKMILPANTVFDNFVTVEEILSQRNRAGILEGPVHVTTI